MRLSKPLHLLLMLCLCWQALAAAGLGVLLTRGDGQLNAQLHFLKLESHHHEADGSVHKDHSLASAQHALDDDCVHAPSILMDFELPLLTASLCAPAEPLRTTIQPPPLRGLERPPRA
jgi:hypothetical protein